MLALIFGGLALFYRIIITLSSLLGLVRSRIKAKNPFAVSNVAKLKNQYVFVFPVYKEQKIILETLAYYTRFLDYSDNITLLFVTTAKETGEQTTADFIARYRNQSHYKEKIKLIESTDLMGTKATQLNFALAFLQKQYQDLPRLVCFDCDARIDWDQFLKAEEYIVSHPQYLVFSYVPQPNLANNTLAVQAIMLHHLERMLTFEWGSAVGSDPLHYPMGACCIILPELWKELSAFPEPIDDIPLSYLLSWKNIPYTSLPFFVRVQAPPNLKNAFLQMIPIYNGVFSYFTLAKKYKVNLSCLQQVAGMFLYIFLISEYVAIVWCTFQAIGGKYWGFYLILGQITIDLLWSNCLNMKNYILHGLGYYIRLFQFIFFLIRGSMGIEHFKTERK